MKVRTKPDPAGSWSESMKEIRRVLLVATTVVVLPLAALAQQTNSPAATEKFDDLRARGFDALYNLDYDGARRYFKELARLYPEHPAGPQFLAATVWAQTLNQSRRLQASIYSSEGFYEKSEDKVDPKIVAEFKEFNKQARTLAQARLKRNSKDVEALYFLGAAEGIKAAFEAAVQRSFISALRNASSSVDRHREVMKLDPAFHDAELSIGFYDYIVGGLPLPVKILASVTGARGSKRRGLATLERVAKEGRWARDDAKVLLIALYKREKRFKDSLALSRELGSRYPRNYLFRLETADALMSQAVLDRLTNPAAADAAQKEAISVFEALLRDRGIRDSGSRSLDLIHYRFGEALFTVGQYESAAKEFLAASTSPGAEPGLATMSLLRGAQSCDLAGKRTEARARYKAVLDRPDVYDAHEQANEGLKQPFRLKNQSQAADSSEEGKES
jgi:tetratricopeptide (TPR) repeat protein